MMHKYPEKKQVQPYHSNWYKSNQIQESLINFFICNDLIFSESVSFFHELLQKITDL